MKKSKWLQTVTAGLGAVIALGACALPTVNAGAEETETKDLHVLWIQDYENDGETASFAIKTTASNTQVREDFESDSFAYISINGYTLTEIMEADETASVTLDGVYLRVTVSAAGYAYCLEETTDDTIAIEKGFSFISGEVTPYDFTYAYDLVFEKFMVVPDPSLLDESRITSLLLLDLVHDSTNERQLFIHFTYPICLEYMSCIQYDPEGMSEQFRSIGWADPNDLYISQLSLFGIRDSILKGVLVDGKSLHEWIYEDGPYVSDPEQLVQIAFLGSWDRGSYMTVLFGNASSCALTNNETHTVTLKAGTTFPTYARMAKDVTLTYNPETNKWGSEFVDKEFYREDIGMETDTDEGCASVTAGTGVVLFAVIVFSVCVWIRKEKKGGKEQ